MARIRSVPLVAWLLLACGTLVMASPIYWMLATALRPRAEVFAAQPSLWPSRLVWSNIGAVFTQYPTLQWLANTATIAVIAVAITVTINLACGYAFAKFRFPGRDVLFFLILSALMIPIQVILVPEFLVVSWFGLLNTNWGVILPRCAEAFGIFMTRQFMLSLPDELIEAGRLDGAGEFQIFWRIVLPLSRPLIAVLVVFTFMWRWNDFAWPLVVLTDQSRFTIQQGLNLLKGDPNPNWPHIMSLALISIAPMLAIFVACQRFIVQGVANTGLK
jgi:multiple sugar transport system permease protein/alpha-1,4-digalacturonate transport system permease protein